MRNSEFLDNERSEDESIGKLQYDEIGPFRMISNKKVYQIEEKTQDDKDMNLIIDRVRVSGMKPWEYLKMLYGPH